MGLTDLTSRLLIEFKGDTSDLKGKLRELTAEEKKLAQAQLEHAEKRNKGLDQWGDKLAKSALILDGVEKVSNLLGDSIGKTAKSMLTAAANGATLGATFAGPVGAAIGGAIGALGSFIARADEQSAASLRAAEAAKKHAAALELVRQGETSSRDRRRQAREELQLAEANWGKASLIVDEQTKKYGHASDGALADLQRTRRAFEDARDEETALNKTAGDIWLEEKKRLVARARAIEDVNAAVQKTYLSEEEGRIRIDKLNGVTREATKVTDESARATEKHTARTSELAQATARLAAERAKLASRVAKELTDDLVKRLEAEQSTPRSVVDSMNEGSFSGIINPDKLSAQLDFRKAYADSEAAGKKKGPTLLERLGLNSPDEMDLALTAVQGFTSGLTTALQALGEGTLSAGDAFKKGLGIMVHAIGDKLAAMAAAEAVEGAAMLVTLNPAGALHLAAAGLLGAGAVAAYAASSKLGGGGGSAPATNAHASAGASGHYAGSTTTYLLGTNAGGGQTINQYIGSTDDDSPRMRQRRAQRFVALGSEHTSVGGSF